jgi:hypothetical protein
MTGQRNRHGVTYLALLVLPAVAALALWIVLSGWVPKTTVALTAVVAFFLIAPVGALWMVYDCAVREHPPFVYFLFAMVPYAFVWYYFVRVRQRGRGAELER